MPLSEPVLRILRRMLDAETKHIFASPKKPAQAISDLAVIHTLHRLRPDITVHGMRSAFRDWCSEETSASNETIETSLAHSVRNATEAAYFRSDLIEKRRALMHQWAKYLVGPETKPLRQVV